LKSLIHLWVNVYFAPLPGTALSNLIPVAALKVGLYRTRPRTRFAALVEAIKQTKVVFRSHGRVLYERL